MRYRISVQLPTGQTAIVKPDADNVFDAVAAAGKMLKDDGHNIGAITLRSTKRLDAAKSGIYIGKVPSKGRGRKKSAPVATETVAPSTPATPVATETVAPSTPATPVATEAAAPSKPRAARAVR